MLKLRCTKRCELTTTVAKCPHACTIAWQQIHNKTGQETQNPMNSNPSSVILCLGPSGSGKTLLLKRLVSPSVDETTSTVETVGSDIVTVSHKAPPKEVGAKDKNRDSGGQQQQRGARVSEKDSSRIREVGGSLAPLWPSYYASTRLIIFVLDASNLFQVSISTTMLMEMISHEKLIATRFLLVLAKRDLATKRDLNYLRFMMRMDALVAEAGGPNRIQVEEVSAISGEGIEAVRTWIAKNNGIAQRGAAAGGRKL